MKDSPSEKVTAGGKRFAQAIGWFWVLLLLIVILATFFPILGRKRQLRQGEIANQNLEILFQAKQELADELNLDPAKPFPEIVSRLTIEDLRQKLPSEMPDLDFGMKGDYTLGPLVDENAEIVPPVNIQETYDPDGNGISNGAEGFFIHRRSYLQDPDTGLWFRDPAFVFPP